MILNAAYVLKKTLRTLASIKSVAARAPNPPAGHGDPHAHILSSFAMIQGMAESAIEFIEEQTPLTLAETEAELSR